MKLRLISRLFLTRSWQLYTLIIPSGDSSVGSFDVNYVFTQMEFQEYVIKNQWWKSLNYLFDVDILFLYLRCNILVTYHFTMLKHNCLLLFQQNVYFFQCFLVLVELVGILEWNDEYYIKLDIFVLSFILQDLEK